MISRRNLLTTAAGAAIASAVGVKPDMLVEEMPWTWTIRKYTTPWDVSKLVIRDVVGKIDIGDMLFSSNGEPCRRIVSHQLVGDNEQIEVE